MKPMDPLTLDNVVKTFRQGDRPVRALDGVSLNVNPGRFVAVMGQSGSGKSTLLHLAAGLTTADAGSVRVAGTDLATMNDKKLTLFRRRQIGLVFQSFNLIPTLTAQENVALPLSLDKKLDDAGRQTVASLLDRLGMAPRASHRPDAMSGGEQQRVAIARALVADPALVLADEPTGNLDSDNGRVVCELLRNLADEGRTIVMVTHEPLVAAFAHEVVVLRDGRLIERFDVGDAEDTVATRYRRAVAAA